MNSTTSTSQYRYLAKDATAFPDFKNQVEVVTCFIEHDDQILVLKRSEKEDQPFMWGIPGGKIDAGVDPDPHTAIVREVLEETGLRLKPSDVILCATRYVRADGWDYTLHLFHLKVLSKPDVTLSEEHLEAAWVAITDFTSLTLLKGQSEAFEVVYEEQ
ncbi:MAG: NUDIX hydrolase [Bacteroidota bacterium]